MNYTSHFFLDGIDGKPYYNFGLILPDLASIFKRGWRVGTKSNTQSISENDMYMMSGIVKHYDLDAIFHQSLFFLDHTKYIKELLRQEKMQLIQGKKHFVAHVLLELIIDRVVILRDESILHRFYHDLDEIEEKEITYFFCDLDPEFVSLFFSFFDKFRKKRFLYKYVENESIIFVLNKVLERVGLLPFTILSDLERLDIIISLIEYAIDEDFQRIIDIRKTADI